MAYVGKFLDKASYRTYCLMGDGESMEGNVWEAINFAGFYKLDNLCAIIDVNRLGTYINFFFLLLKLHVNDEKLEHLKNSVNIL